MNIDTSKISFISFGSAPEVRLGTFDNLNIIIKSITDVPYIVEYKPAQPSRDMGWGLGSTAALPDRFLITFKGLSHVIWIDKTRVDLNDEVYIRKNIVTHFETEKLALNEKKKYTYDFPMPAVTVDVVVLCGDKVLLVTRANNPFGGRLALPGGYVEPNETLVHAALRELKEETGLELYEEDLTPIGVRDNPSRDPRNRTFSFAYLVDLGVDANYTKFPVKNGSDAASACWYDLIALRDDKEALGEGANILAFDHDEILEEACTIALDEEDESREFEELLLYGVR